MTQAIRDPKICGNPECRKRYIPNSNNQKYCSMECKLIMKRSLRNQLIRDAARKKQNQKLPPLDNLSPDELLRYGKTQSKYYL